MKGFLPGIGVGMLLSIILLHFKLEECKSDGAEYCAIELGWPNAKFIAILKEKNNG